MSDCSGFGKNVIIFGGDSSSSTHIDNRKKDILILGKDSTQGLEDTILTAKPEYFINFSELGKCVTKMKMCCSNMYYQ